MTGSLIPSRRRFLQGGLTTAAGTMLHAAWGAEPDRFRTVTLSVTTDLHGHILPTSTYGGVGPVGGMARCVTQIRRWKKENPHHLVIDAGDVYQGTHVSQSTDGQLMIDLLNRVGYDAWVVGNHEFDWGSDTLLKAIGQSKMPVLGANLSHEGVAAGESVDKAHPFAGMSHSLLREVGGMKIGIVGLTTPGLPYWIPDGLLGDFTVQDPVEPVRQAVKVLQAEGADAIVAVGHMGIKIGGDDDFANRVKTVLGEVEGIDVFIAGHTHKDVSSFPADGVKSRVLYTQAGYHGIHCGRVDLTFDLESRKLVDRRAFTIFMDDRFELDPLVLQIAGEHLDTSEESLATEVGETTEVFGSRSEGNEPSALHQLMAAAIREGLGKRGAKVDAILHGTFLTDDLPAGKKTLADVWKLVPYDNTLVVAELSVAELLVVLKEMSSVRSSINQLTGLGVVRKGGRSAVTSVFDQDGKPIPEGKRVRIAFNSYDAQSGGQRYPKLREIVAQKGAKTELHPVQTRDLMTDFFVEEKSISTKRLAEICGVKS